MTSLAARLWFFFFTVSGHFFFLRLFCCFWLVSGHVRPRGSIATSRPDVCLMGSILWLHLDKIILWAWTGYFFVSFCFSPEAKKITKKSLCSHVQARLSMSSCALNEVFTDAFLFFTCLSLGTFQVVQPKVSQFFGNWVRAAGKPPSKERPKVYELFWYKSLSYQHIIYYWIWLYTVWWIITFWFYYVFLFGALVPEKFDFGL